MPEDGGMGYGRWMSGPLMLYVRVAQDTPDQSV